MVQERQREAHSDAGFESSIPGAPITMERPVPQDLDRYLKNPGAPRANLTVDKEHPQGTYSPPEDMTVLQQHIAFWDADSDGTIWPLDTYRGFRKLGFNVFISLLAIPLIHGTFAYWSQDSWIPNPGMPIYVKNAHRTKHGSDSECFDNEGRFVPQKFEEIFTKFDKGNKGALTKDEIWEFTQANRNVNDPMGWIAEKLEWYVTYLLAAQDTPQGRVITKDDMRGALDGTLFFRVAEAREAGRIKRQGVAKAGFTPAKGGEEEARAARKEE